MADGTITKAGSTLKRAMHRADAWLNDLTGLGTDRDKRESGDISQLSRLPDKTLEGMYHHDDMAGTVVDAQPEEELREPYEIRVENDRELASDVMSAAEDLGMRDALLEARTMGRLYGGAAIMLGAEDGQEMSEPLDLQRLQRLQYLHVLTRIEMVPQTWDADPESPTFGKPLTFLIQPQLPGGTGVARQATVHRSRFIFFPGARTSPRARNMYQGWDASVLQRPYTVIRDFGMSWAGASHLMQDISQGVFKVQGLHELIGQGDWATILTRLQTLDKQRSVTRAIPVDAETEDFERKQTPMTGIPETLQLFIQRLAGAARMPATVLMGMSPAGMNATGESDIRWWYNRVESSQQNVLRPRMNRMLEVLFAANDGPSGGRMPDDWDIHFAPLWKPTAKESAEMKKTMAEVDRIYAGELGGLAVEEVVINRFGPDGWSMETTVDLEPRREILEEDTQPGDGGDDPEPPEDDEEGGQQHAEADDGRQDAKEPGTRVQTLIFSKQRFDKDQAKRWARRHGFRTPKTDETRGSVRIRQRRPSEFRRDTLRTITMTDGVQAVVGFLRRR